MSIGLAMAKIAFYTGQYDFYSTQVNNVQSQLFVLGVQAAQPGQAAQAAQAQGQERQKLAAYTFLQGLAKEFVEYWKQVAKDFLAMVKSLQELAQGAR